MLNRVVLLLFLKAADSQFSFRHFQKKQIHIWDKRRV